MPADLPAAIAPLASPPLPGEGQWHPLVLGPSGAPIVEGAALRPDAQHTSELAYVAWLNQKALTFALHPGYQQPGGSWQPPNGSCRVVETRCRSRRQVSTHAAGAVGALWSDRAPAGRPDR